MAVLAPTLRLMMFGLGIVVPTIVANGAPETLATPTAAVTPIQIASVEFVDSDNSLSVTAGDVLDIQFKNRTSGAIKLAGFSLVHAEDTFGEGAKLNADPSGRGAALTLGREPRLKIGGVYSPTSTTRASAVVASGRAVDIDDARIRRLEAKYRDEYVKRIETISTKLKTYDSQKFYDVAPYLDGLTSMYEATGNSEYLDFAIVHVEEMLAHAKDLTGDGYLDFFSAKLKRPNVQLYDWRGFRPLARLTRLIATDPALRCRYKDTYDRYRSFIDKQLVEKWSATYAKRDIKFTHPFVPYEREALIHRAAHMGLILIDYQLMADNAIGRAGIHAIAAPMKKQIRPSGQEPSAVEWNILYKNSGAILRDRDSILGVSDVSHGSGTVAFVATEALATRLEFGDSDLDALSNTLLKVIWNGDRAKPKLSDFVDGGISSDKPNRYGETNLADGWVLLGAHRGDVQELLMLLEERGQTGLVDFQFGANLARNFRYARWY